LAARSPAAAEMNTSSMQRMNEFLDAIKSSSGDGKLVHCFHCLHCLFVQSHCQNICSSLTPLFLLCPFF
jgi:hypothetical protein